MNLDVEDVTINDAESRCQWPFRIGQRNDQVSGFRVIRSFDIVL